MKRFLGTLAFVGVAATVANAVQVRYFLSQTGLMDPNDPDSPAVLPSNIGVDKVIDTTVEGTSQRFYLWAQLGPGAANGGVDTDLKGFDLAFRTTGDVQIDGGLIWQNNFVPAVTTRWNASGIPGAFGPDGSGQFADPSPAVAVLEAGVTNGAFSAFDDQWIADPLYAAVVGYLEVTGNEGEVHVINQGSGFLQIDPNNRVLLGWDDAIGAPAEVPGSPYDTLSPEAALVPEPASLTLLGLAALALRRRD